MLTNTQRSELQQAVWQLERTRALIHSALGDTDSGQETILTINGLIADLEADLLDD